MFVERMHKFKSQVDPSSTDCHITAVCIIAKDTRESKKQRAGLDW